MVGTQSGPTLVPNPLPRLLSLAVYTIHTACDRELGTTSMWQSLLIKMVASTFISFLPSGLFLDNTIDVARKELAWETDYTREAQCGMKFK